ncbi:MAG: hypothetical protein ACYCOU_09935 [Sulfobacillus sp.]
MYLRRGGSCLGTNAVEDQVRCDRRCPFTIDKEKCGNATKLRSEIPEKNEVAVECAADGCGSHEMMESQETPGKENGPGNLKSQGLQGLQESQGTQGLQEPQGLQGLQEPQGTQGLQEPQGTQGLQGLQDRAFEDGGSQDRCPTFRIETGKSADDNSARFLHEKKDDCQVSGIPNFDRDYEVVPMTHEVHAPARATKKKRFFR